ncbi:hypothetical protein HMPREF0860_1115 [Treponema socranskii subsp. socranskii VPI DR56BR1116 = ATCC 35536]|uniref:Uncharacterized protein n=1 Tax=Treponema socranskii subsp. socranskii VPI DR56BR1116 = ATCC 35536 TaxID=1125725 RepID=A0ABN0P3F9_TRESO|nr:hypothetical protein HMPREF0860_1115 [Treponema socranskii subsp. socranskii VPI DR56BR1116 = ATCC 35536]
MLKIPTSRSLNKSEEDIKEPLKLRGSFNFEFSFENSLIYYMCANAHGCGIFEN